MRKITVLLSVLLLTLGMTGVAALAQTEGDGPPDWLDDTIAEDSTTVIVTEPDPVDPPPFDGQEAEITIEGPTGLELNEFGEYTVTVTNTAEERDLDQWALGLSVTNIEDVSELIIRYKGGDGADITEGTSGVEAYLDTTNNILYLRGSDDPVLAPGDDASIDFEVSFAKTGAFIGTAYVISTDVGSAFAGLEADDHQFFPYYDENAGTNQDLDPVFTEHPITGNGDFVVCTLDRTRYREPGASGSGTSTNALISDNRVKCYNANGELGYEQYLIIVNQNHAPFYQGLVDAGHPTAFNGAWVLFSLEVDGVNVEPTDVGASGTYAYLGFS